MSNKNNKNINEDYHNILSENGSNLNTENKDAWLSFIESLGEYKYFITITFNRDYKANEIMSNINFLLKVINCSLFHCSNSKIKLRGFAFFESSSIYSSCSHHFHILLNDNPKFGVKKPFEDLFYDSLKKVRSIQQDNDKHKCNDIQEIKNNLETTKTRYYCMKDFWKDIDGNFIKLISETGLV